MTEYLDPNQSYDVSDGRGHTDYGVNGAAAADLYNFYSNDPRNQWSQQTTGYTSSGGGYRLPGFSGANDVSFEQIVRHWQIVNTAWPTPSAPVAPEQTPEAFLQWGEAADFSTDDTPSDPVEDINADGYGIPVSSADGSISNPSTLSAGGVSLGFPLGTNTGLPGSAYGAVGRGQIVKQPPKLPQDKRAGVTTFNEIDRVVQRIPVFNPKDPEQYVIVQRILSMRFRGSNGSIMKFNLKPPPPPPVPSAPVEAP